MYTIKKYVSFCYPTQPYWLFIISGWKLYYIEFTVFVNNGYLPSDGNIIYQLEAIVIYKRLSAEWEILERVWFKKKKNRKSVEFLQRYKKAEDKNKI